MEINETLYEKGFSNGYLIAKREPELFTVLEKGFQSKNDYSEGFVAGGKGYELDM